MATQQTKRHFIRILIISLLLIGLSVVAVLNYNFIVDTIVGFSYEADAELSTVVLHLDLTDDGMRILKASRPELQQAESFNRSCPSVSMQTSTLGCYFMSKIYVYDIDRKELNGIKEAVMAHELLHAVWKRLGEGEREELRSDLDQVYKDNILDLKEHMDNYDAEDYYDELHSVIGTQVEADKMTAKLRQHYAKYFNNPQTIVGYYNSYNDVLQKYRKESQRLYDLITANKAKIERQTEAYKKSLANLNQDIENYNKEVSAGTLDYYERVAIYNDLVARRTKLGTEYDELSQLVDETNELVDQYNENVIHVGELFDSIDSKAARPSDL